MARNRCHHVANCVLITCIKFLKSGYEQCGIRLGRYLGPVVDMSLSGQVANNELINQGPALAFPRSSSIRVVMVVGPVDECSAA